MQVQALLSMKRLEKHYRLSGCCWLSIGFGSDQAGLNWIGLPGSLSHDYIPPPPSAVVIVSRQSHSLSLSLDSSDQLRLARSSS